MGEATEQKVVYLSKKPKLMSFPVLTPREEKVFRQLLLGKSNQQIAEVLGISVNTVKTHVKNILKKKEVNSRISLILGEKVIEEEEIHPQK